MLLPLRDKGRLGPPEAGRGKEGPSPGPRGGGMVVLPHTWMVLSPCTGQNGSAENYCLQEWPVVSRWGVPLWDSSEVSVTVSQRYFCWHFHYLHVREEGTQALQGEVTCLGHRARLPAQRESDARGSLCFGQ